MWLYIALAAIVVALIWHTNRAAERHVAAALGEKTHKALKEYERLMKSDPVAAERYMEAFNEQLTKQHDVERDGLRARLHTDPTAAATLGRLLVKDLETDRDALARMKSAVARDPRSAQAIPHIEAAIRQGEAELAALKPFLRQPGDSPAAG